MKIKNKDDLRYLKTNQELVDAFLDCLRSQLKVKVLDICQRANISAMTYYHHFESKKDLIEFTINNQLFGYLPIPRKLKPINLKHLIQYLIENSIRFANKNKEIICCAIKHLDNEELKDSYIDICIRTIYTLIFNEIKTLCPNLDYFNTNIWANVICGSILKLIMSICLNNYRLQPQYVWNSLKKFTSYLQ